MREYYYLISSLPDPELDSQKKMPSLDEFLAFCEEELSGTDFLDLKKIFIFNDIMNIIRVKTENDPYTTPSFYGQEHFLENLSDYQQFFPFIEIFLENKKNDKREYPDLLEIDELITLFYENLDSMTENVFIKKYFTFVLDLKNVIISLSLEKLGIDASKACIPYGEAYERVSKSLALDNGTVPKLEKLLEAINGTDVVVTEKLIDEIKWFWLDEEIAHEYFSFKYLVGYAVKLSSIERWAQLTDIAGKAVLDGLVDKIKSSITFSDEFIKTGGKK